MEQIQFENDYSFLGDCTQCSAGAVDGRHDSAMRAATRLSASQQKRAYRKDEGVKKPGRPKKDETQKDDTHVVEVGKAVQSQVAPVWRFDCNQPSHSGEKTNEAWGSLQFLWGARVHQVYGHQRRLYSKLAFSLQIALE
jgi:hypothetical protein